MRKHSGGRFLLGVAFVLTLGFWAIAAPTNPARATALLCGSGSICDFDLTNSNVSAFTGKVDVRVEVDNSGSKTVLRVKFISMTAITNTASGIDMFGFTGPTGVGSGGSPTGWSQTSGANLDGFGSFSFKESNSASTDCISSFCNFTLVGLVTSFPDNGNPSHSNFAVHLRFISDTSCSGFVANGTSSSSLDLPSGCTASLPQPVSEPSVLALAGLGLFGAAYLRRR